jgi:hypothetical protein
MTKCTQQLLPSRRFERLRLTLLATVPLLFVGCGESVRTAAPITKDTAAAVKAEQRASREEAKQERIAAKKNRFGRGGATTKAPAEQPEKGADTAKTESTEKTE